MENNKLRKVIIKNCTCYHFDDIITLKDFDFDYIIDISYKTSIGAKPLCIRFDKIDGFIGVYDGTRYLVLFVTEKYDTLYNRIRYLTEV